MGFRTDKPFSSLVPDDLVERGGRAVMDAGQDFLYDAVRERTPTANLPEAYHGDRASWVEDRGGRRPGTLKDSWVKVPVTEDADGLKGAVETEDPVGPLVEDDTRPHIIRPRVKKALRFPSGPIFRLAAMVRHPGTEGQHMMRDSLAELKAEWPRLGQRALDRVFAEENRR